MLATATIPLAPRFAGLTIPQRMLVVIRRHRAIGDGTTTRENFRQAEETCDLTDAELDANIGAAKRLADPETVRFDQPQAPAYPWETDRAYRRQRVERAANLIVGLTPDPGQINTVLRTNNYEPREVGDLYGEIINAAARIFSETRGPRV